MATSTQAAEDHRKKVVYIDSYHAGYAWSDSVYEGILKGLNMKVDQFGRVNTNNSPIQLKTIRMDTKRNVTEKSKKEAALKAKEVIDDWQPDVVIASDDNASEYLIVPYFKGSKLPVVFCGINWDASIYGFPCRNVTGMVEVTLAPETLAMLRKYARGDRTGVIAADVLSERRTVENFKKKFGMRFEKEYFAHSFDEWKKRFKQLQSEVDMILFTCHAGISGWDNAAAKAFVAENITVPVGTMDSWVIDFAVIGLTKIGSEQGEWAAHTALRILEGESPGNISLAKNRRAKVYLNMRLAKKLGIKFPMDIINRATFVD